MKGLRQRNRSVNCSVSCSPGWFCAVGGDMKVEQTIQLVSKALEATDVVGATRNVSAVAEFELLLHEIGAITNLLNYFMTHQSMNVISDMRCTPLVVIQSTRIPRSYILNFVQARQNPYSLAADINTCANTQHFHKTSS